MKIFFDVDLTLLCSDGASQALRPGTREVFQRLNDMGHQVYVWTATGREHAEWVVSQYDLGEWVAGCMDKDSNPPIWPDMVVDDDWYLAQKYSGVCVTPYREPDPNDRELFKIFDALEAPPRSALVAEDS